MWLLTSLLVLQALTSVAQGQTEPPVKASTEVNDSCPNVKYLIKYDDDPGNYVIYIILANITNVQSVLILSLCTLL